MLRSHQGGADRPPTPADDIQPPQGELHSCGGAGWAGGQSLRRLREKTEEENMLSSISPFQDYPNNPRTFI